jgi:hypothetical protein
MAQMPTNSNSTDTHPAPNVTGNVTGNVTAAHDERANLAAIHSNLYDGEAVHRIYRGHGSGAELLAVTSLRIMLIERTAWGDRLALTSVPFSRITAVSLLAGNNQPIDSTTTVGIRVASLTFTLSCADAGQAREAHDLINWPLYH